MRKYWFCPINLYEHCWIEIDKQWEFVSYSEYSKDGTPRIVELRRREQPVESKTDTETNAK